jgi:hypothetical protein
MYEMGPGPYHLLKTTTTMDTNTYLFANSDTTLEEHIRVIKEMQCSAQASPPGEPTYPSNRKICQHMEMARIKWINDAIITAMELQPTASKPLKDMTPYL